jgi:hypothetical protein
MKSLDGDGRVVKKKAARVDAALCDESSGLHNRLRDRLLKVLRQDRTGLLADECARAQGV